VKQFLQSVCTCQCYYKANVAPFISHGVLANSNLICVLDLSSLDLEMIWQVTYFVY